jgi:hypothetical protein
MVQKVDHLRPLYRGGGAVMDRHVLQHEAVREPGEGLEGAERVNKVIASG